MQIHRFKGCGKKSDYTDSRQNTPYSPTAFLGYPVHIFDGGAHSENMQHFANAISPDMDIEVHNVDVNQKYNTLKQLKSLEAELKKANQNYKPDTDDYIAIPALACVPLLNLNDQYKKIMNDQSEFNPENIKANKQKLLDFLKLLYDSPDKYRRYINYMDTSGQGIEYTYGVIREINSLIEKGARVYIPSGHPHMEVVKWMAKNSGKSPELYNFIATGNDTNGAVNKMFNKARDNLWYDFNLLSLSDAHVVGIKDKTQLHDYLFAAYDSCITDGARGVYNFTPIRDRRDKLVGYSYTDRETNQYPYEEFPANDEVADIAKFVGKKFNSVVANEAETEELRKAIIEKTGIEHCADKLYPVGKLKDLGYLESKKTDLEGDYVDRTGKLYFRKNEYSEVIYPRCDCEGSGRPSVLSMWGSCFSVFNAIKNNIELRDNNFSAESLSEKINLRIQSAQAFQEAGLSNLAIEELNQAILYNKLIKEEADDKKTNQPDNSPYLLLGDLLAGLDKKEDAKNCYNIYINEQFKFLAQQMEKRPKIFPRPDLSAARAAYIKFLNIQSDWREYEKQTEYYNNSLFFKKMFSAKPIQPAVKQEPYICTESCKTIIESIADTYGKIGKICAQQGEAYPAVVCAWASENIKNCTENGNDIMKRRLQDIQYIGDLYDADTKN